MDANILIGMLAVARGKLEYNEASEAWFYTIPVKFKRSIVGSGKNLSEAVEQAFEEWTKQ